MSTSNPPLPQVRLVARAPDEGTEIQILDGDLNLVPLEQHLGEVSVELPAGVYRVRFQRGSAYTDKTAVLTPGSGATYVTLAEAEAPRFSTAAPVRKTTSTREIHRQPAQDLSLTAPMRPPTMKAGGSRLLVFARDLEAGRHGDPSQGVTLHDLQGNQICDFSAVGERQLAEGWAGCHLELAPGAYRLRSQGRRTRFAEQAIYTCAGWQTQVFLLAGATDEDEDTRRGYLANLSLLMARFDHGFDYERDDLRWTEVALSALERRGRIPGSVSSEMLWAKFQNPMLGIYGGLLHLRRNQTNADLLRQVFLALVDLVGPLPDVLALGLAALRRHPPLRDDDAMKAVFQGKPRVTTPPMLSESWTHLVEASGEQPELIPPDSLAGRIAGQVAAGGAWLTWRGEPAAAEQGMDGQEVALAAAPGDPEATRSWGALGNIARALGRPLSLLSVWVAVPLLRKALRQTPDVAYLLDSPPFTELERRIARFVEPTSDPVLASFFDEVREAGAGEPSDDADEEPERNGANLLEELRVPAGSALWAMGSLYLKLAQSPIPNGLVLATFVERESHDRPEYRLLLRRLTNRSSALHHRRSGRHVNGLELVYLYYHGGGPAASDPDYVWDSSDPELAHGMGAAIDEIRQVVVDDVETLVKKEHLELPAGWEQKVLPPPNAYVAGQLLPVPAIKTAPPAQAAG
ncbi:MAG TPA: hypothetical protein VF310_14800 [Vicinamibacteria bacterium]